MKREFKFIQINFTLILITLITYTGIIFLWNTASQFTELTDICFINTVIIFDNEDERSVLMQFSTGIQFENTCLIIRTEKSDLFFRSGI